MKHQMNPNLEERVQTRHAHLANEARSYCHRGTLLLPTRHALIANEARSYCQRGTPLLKLLVSGEIISSLPAPSMPSAFRAKLIGRGPRNATMCKKPSRLKMQRALLSSKAVRPNSSDIINMKHIMDFSDEYLLPPLPLNCVNYDCVECIFMT